jgi:hypothetical protein
VTTRTRASVLTFCTSAFVERAQVASSPRDGFSITSSAPAASMVRLISTSLRARDEVMTRIGVG